MCTRHCILCLFFNQEMLICHRCNLCKMCNTDHLMFFSNQCHLFRHFLCRTSADTNINFIKDQCLNLIFICHYSFDRQHDSGKLTTGSNFCQWFHLLSLVERNTEFCIINTIFGIFFLFRKMYLKLHLFKIQVFQAFLDLLFQHVCLLLSKSRKFLCPFKIILFQLLTGCFQFLHIRIIVFQNFNSFFLLLTVLHDLFIRVTIFRLQMIDLI